MDLLVEPLVRAAHRTGIAEQIAVRRHHVAQDADFLGRGVTGRQTRGQTFQFAAHDVKFCHLRVVERRHNQRAAIAGQQALGFQTLQRFADGRARYPETFGKVAFHKAVTRLVDMAVDGIEDQLVGVLVLRRRGI